MIRRKNILMDNLLIIAFLLIELFYTNINGQSVVDCPRLFNNIFKGFAPIGNLFKWTFRKILYLFY